jgi:hypothetical protein
VWFAAKQTQTTFWIYYLLTMTMIGDLFSPVVIASAMPLSWMIWWIVSILLEGRERGERENRVPNFALKRTNTVCILCSVESRLLL